jgi:hypothetical protein
LNIRITDFSLEVQVRAHFRQQPAAQTDAGCCRLPANGHVFGLAPGIAAAAPYRREKPGSWQAAAWARLRRALPRWPPRAFAG